LSLPDSYTFKPNAVPAYFDAIASAQPPDRFSIKFLEKLGFTSTNDRLFVGILKDLGFLNRDGAPQSRYFAFLDATQSKKVLADGIREAFSELFAVNTKAHELTAKDATSKLRMLYAGKKTDLVISHIAKTFKALCDYADFSQGLEPKQATEAEPTPEQPQSDYDAGQQKNENRKQKQPGILGLQYHINVVLPETRDQAVYDAIFKSLREHI
jgi:hypothetical protein